MRNNLIDKTNLIFLKFTTHIFYLRNLKGLCMGL